jgi:hypothetical protein
MSMQRVSLGLAMAATVIVTLAVTGAAGPSGGAIRGVVRSGTSGLPVAGAPVQLVFIGSQGAEPVGDARSGADGRFSFAGLLDGRYLVTARWQGVSYAAHAVLTGGAQVDTGVQVYDASPRVALRASLLGVAVDVQQGYVRVNEVVHLVNPSTRTFLGDVTFPLPAGARFVVFGEGFHQPRVSGPAITDRLIVRPGGHQVAYMYAVRGNGEVALDRRVALPVDRLELFVAAPAEARSPRLQGLPSVANEGQTYTRASGRAVPPGDLALTIAGVPSLRLWAAPAAAGTLAAMLVVGLMWAVSRTAPNGATHGGGVAGRPQKP